MSLKLNCFEAAPTEACRGFNCYMFRYDPSRTPNNNINGWNQTSTGVLRQPLRLVSRLRANTNSYHQAASCSFLSITNHGTFHETFFEITHGIIFVMLFVYDLYQCVTLHLEFTYRTNGCANDI